MFDSLDKSELLESVKDKKLRDYIHFLEQYRKIVDESNIVSKTDPKGIITYVNPKFTEISGYRKEELLGKNHNIIRHPEMPSSAFKNLWETIEAGKTWHGIVKNKKKDGGYYIVDATIIPIAGSDGNVMEYIAIRKDITRLIEQSKKIRKQTTDSLTGLPNYAKLSEDAGGSKPKTLILFNIDLFREIVDFYGEKIANQVLIQIGEKLQSLMQSTAKGFKVYKLYGDEFVYFKNTQMDMKELDDYLFLLLDELGRYSSLMVNNIEIHYSLSIGGYTGSQEFSVNKAKIALKYARQNKRHYYVYNEDLQKHHRENLNVVRLIKHAIATNRIIPYYQPILNNTTNTVEKYESLARIIDTNQGVLDPETFLATAKKSRLYPYITRSIIENVLKLAKDKRYEFSINLSVEDIIDKKIQSMILSTVKNADINQKNLIFEITESENIENFVEVKEFIESAKELGCKIAIDDFGSGYSNFEYLAELHVDFIKIDGSLIRNINTSRNLQVIVGTIINFAKEMSIKTVAEYIHSKEVFETVRDLGIEYSQGFYIGKPIPLEEFNPD